MTQFVEQLPNQLSQKLTLEIYRQTYMNIDFLCNKPSGFIVWICPLLKPAFFAQDQRVYSDKEPVEAIFFMIKGGAGYVLAPGSKNRNVVYVEVMQGDHFGQVDIMSCSLDTGVAI